MILIFKILKQLYFFSFVLAFSTFIKRTKIFVFRSSFIRTIFFLPWTIIFLHKKIIVQAKKKLSKAKKNCPLDGQFFFLPAPIFPYKLVKTLVNFTKFDFFRKVLFELLENSRPTACYFQWNSWKL